MAWVQVGSHKINTAQIYYIEQNGETVRLHFHGQWQGNPLELHQEEARLFWRHLKAEDPAAGRDKGSTTVLPRMRSAVTLEMGMHQNADKPKPAAGEPGHVSSHSHHAAKQPEPKRH